MTNYEFYKNEIIEAVIHDETCEFKKGYVFKRKSCKNAQCSECSCKTKEWLNSEHKEPVTISKIEFTILNEVDNKWKYIARDSDGNLFLYKDRPYKNAHYWIDDNIHYHCFNAFNELFKFIKWEDEEPYEIAKLIADYEKDNVNEEV